MLKNSHIMHYDLETKKLAHATLKTIEGDKVRLSRSAAREEGRRGRKRLTCLLFQLIETPVAASEVFNGGSKQPSHILLVITKEKYVISLPLTLRLTPFCVCSLYAYRRDRLDWKPLTRASNLHHVESFVYATVTNWRGVVPAGMRRR